MTAKSKGSKGKVKKKSKQVEAKTRHLNLEYRSEILTVEKWSTDGIRWRN